MFRKFTTLTFGFLLVGNYCISQNLIARHSAGSVNFYTSIPSAISASIAGDTLYLPGGAFPGFNISKSLTIIGAGYDLDSTIATGRTYISGTTTIGISVANAIIKGIWFEDLVCEISSNNIEISNCYIKNQLAFYSSTCSNYIIRNCILNNISGGGSTQHFVSNNILFSQIYNIDYSVISNNVFYTENEYPLGSCDYTTIQNNIFLNDVYQAYPSNLYNIIYNNAFVNKMGDICNNGTENYGSTNDCGMNFYTMDEYSIFTTYLSESYLQSQYGLLDLNILPGSILNNAGNDGTDLGIYGGSFIWKEGGLPQNPHISSKIIPSVSDNDGTLDVDIKVNAQDN